MLSRDNKPKSKKSNKNSSLDIISTNDDEDLGEIMSFDDDQIDIGTVINTFSLGCNDDDKNSKISNLEKDTSETINEPEKHIENEEVLYSNDLETKTVVDNKPSLPKGLTTPIDGENFNIRRSYQFRESTLRKLTELKAIDPDINIYFNQILDKAICFYYDHVVNKNS